MKKDIDMYKDGFNSKIISCIVSPIAAAAGYYDRKYYFYFCYLYSLINYYGIKEDTDNKNLYEVSNIILNMMGLSMTCLEYNNDYDKALKDIQNELSNNRIVYLVCKYNSLFYSNYYGNTNYKLAHGLLVSGFDNENETFIINESTLLKSLFSDCDNADVFFPLQITYDSLKSILMKSNVQFDDIKNGVESFSNKFFYIQKDKNVNLSSYDVISKSISLISGNTNRNSFLSDVIKYFEDRDTLLDFTYHEYFSKYVWGLEPIFRLLRIHAKGNKTLELECDCFEKEIQTSRQLIVSKFVKIVMKKEKISEGEKDQILHNWYNGDKKLMELIKRMSFIDNSIKYEYKNIDIKKYYNCQAFEEKVLDDSVADITGEGTHFLFENVTHNEKWINGNYKFVYNYVSKQNDNVSCKGQKVYINDSFESTGIAFLECAEYGCYKEKITVEYKDGRYYTFTAFFSDFYQSSIYDEKLFWDGVALDRKNGKTVRHNFNARIFAKRYEIPKGIINSIQLPNRRNVHIFAITLEKEV